jgi:hypothetical protein
MHLPVHLPVYHETPCALEINDIKRTLMTTGTLHTVPSKQGFDG